MSRNNTYLNPANSAPAQKSFPLQHKVHPLSRYRALHREIQLKIPKFHKHASRPRRRKPAAAAEKKAKQFYICFFSSHLFYHRLTARCFTAYCFTASTPGKVPASIYSNKAPPPVEM